MSHIQSNAQLTVQRVVMVAECNTIYILLVLSFRLVRNTGLNIADKLNPDKNLMIKQAMGINDSLLDLARPNF